LAGQRRNKEGHQQFIIMEKKTKIGIIGLGYVGGSVRRWFEKQKKFVDLFLYDKYKNIGSVSEVNKADIIFVAVPTPFRDKSGYDDSAVKNALKNINDGKIVVLKSTIVPGSTQQFQKLYPKKTVLFNPEFLRAKTAKEDFLKPNIQLVGYVNSKGRKLAPKILRLLPKAPYSKIIRAGEAEMVKYFTNTFLATRVIFANQIYDLCRKLKSIDYEVVKHAVIQDERIGTSHFDIFADGYRGYGGLCLPKDTKALIQYAKKLNVGLDLLKKVDEINEKLKNQKR
jgi:UDPglucose 6-dehydrogenase